MQIAVLVFDDLTTLDAIGPIEVLAKLPNADVRIAAKQKGEIRVRENSGGLGLIADYALSDVPHPEILLIPGGMGTRVLLQDREILDWIRQAHQSSTWTTSVCTGSLLLGAAGLLRGLRATTHWKAMDMLHGFGAVPTKERVVFEGKIVTAAGVSAGIDMALHLAARIAGETTAQAIQLAIEYDPQPPFNAGSVDKAPLAIMELVKNR